MIDITKWSQMQCTGVIAFLCLPLLYISSTTARYYFKYTIYIGLVSLTAIVVIPLFLFSPKDYRNIMYTSYWLRNISKVVGIKWELRGRDILSKDRGAVICANHQTMFDILGMFEIWPVMRKCFAVAKKELFYVWPFGLGAWLGGVVFIDRVQAKKAYQQLSEVSYVMNSKQGKLWMFPEGTRNPKNTTLLPFKKGAFRLAIVAQVPIIPLVYSPYYFINRKKNFFGKGKVIIECLEPISTEGMTLDDIDSLTEQTRNVMIKKYEELYKEVMTDIPPNYPGLS